MLQTLKSLSRFLIGKYPFAVVLLLLAILVPSPSPVRAAAISGTSTLHEAQCTLEDLDGTQIQIRCHSETVDNSVQNPQHTSGYAGASYHSEVVSVNIAGQGVTGTWRDFYWQKDAPNTGTFEAKYHVGQSSSTPGDIPHGYAIGQSLCVNIQTYWEGPRLIACAVLSSEPGWPADWYTGGVAGGEPASPPDECTGLTIDITDDTGTFVEGDVMTLDVVNSATNPVASLELRMSDSRPWQGVFTGMIGTTGSFDVTVRPGAVVVPSAVLFKCVRAGGSIGYFTYGSGVVADADLTIRGCSAARVYWPERSDAQGLNAGESFDVTVDYTGPFGTQLEDVAVRARWRNDLALGIPGMVEGEFFIDTWVDLGTFTSGSRSTVAIVVPALDPFPLNFDIDVLLALECTDASGTILNAGTWSPNFVFLPGETNCYSGTGISYAPSSWVPGLLKGGVCTAQLLVIPNRGFVADWVETEADRWSDEPPFIFLAAGVEFGQTAHAALVDPTADACFALNFDDGPLSGASDCVGFDSADTSSFRPLLAVLMIAPMIMGVIAHAYSLVRPSA